MGKGFINFPEGSSDGVTELLIVGNAYLLTCFVVEHDDSFLECNEEDRRLR